MIIFLIILLVITLVGLLCLIEVDFPILLGLLLISTLSMTIGSVSKDSEMKSSKKGYHVWKETTTVNGKVKEEVWHLMKKK